MAMKALPLPRFNQPTLASAIEALPLSVLDTLPFGIIRLNQNGLVEIYNETERRLSGSGSRPRLGLDFFTSVAPCMNQAGFRGRIERALKLAQFDLEFAWTGDFGDRLRSLTIRAQPATGGGCWIFINRDGG